MGIRNWLVEQLEEHRGLVVVLFCLPASFIFDIVLRVKDYLTNSLFPAISHQDKVTQIQELVRKWARGPRDRFMCTARPNWLSLSTTFANKSQLHAIPINLNNILHLDEENLLLRTEPLVSVGEAVAFLRPRGYALAVTLEIGDATVGGLALAVGMTTHSHKVGLYQETVVSYDIVLGDGRLVQARADNEHADLFKCLPWSHGTLGFLVALELKLIPIKPYVHLRYIPVKGQKNYCDMIRKLSGAVSPSDPTPDYLEATVYSPDQAVIMVGNLADIKTPQDYAKVNHVTRWYKPWFYKHVESFLGREGEEFIPLDEYLLRHNRAIFWVVEAMIPFGNKPLFRLMFGWLLPPKPAFLKFTTTKGIREMTFTKQVFQDIVLPMTVLEPSIDLATELFDTFPLLVYPCKVFNRGPQQGQIRAPRQEQMTPDSDYGMFYDLGVYGVPGKVRRKEPYHAAKTMHKMEEFIRGSGGYSFLYADYTMTEDELADMFDLSLYKSVRRQYAAEGAFPDLFTKTRSEIDLYQVADQYYQH